MDLSTGWPKSDIHTWIYPWISISTATLALNVVVDKFLFNVEGYVKLCITFLWSMKL